MIKPRRQDIPIKSPDEIERMHKAGQVLARVLDECHKACVAGMTTADLENVAAREIAEAGAEALFLWYPSYEPGKGFPASTCISVNEEIVHGIPGDRVIQDGDLVSIDCGVRVEGWCADAAVTIPVGNVSDKARILVEKTRALRDHAIARMRPGIRWSEIARLMQEEAEAAGYGIVREYVGHGIGRSMHEPPKVPNLVSRETIRDDFTLAEGMVLAVEPMLTLGSGDTVSLDDGWTVVTRDRSLAAHEEHTVGVTANGPRVLTDGT